MLIPGATKTELVKSNNVTVLTNIKIRVISSEIFSWTPYLHGHPIYVDTLFTWTPYFLNFRKLHLQPSS